MPSLYDHRSPTHPPSLPPSLFLLPPSYIAVNPAIGLKRRGAKGRVELKVLTEEGKEEEGDIKGIEKWKKYKASWVVMCSISLSLLFSLFSAVDHLTSFFLFLFLLVNATQIGKGLAEEETLAQVHTLLEVRKTKGERSSHTIELSHPPLLFYYTISLFMSAIDAWLDRQSRHLPSRLGGRNQERGGCQGIFFTLPPSFLLFSHPSPFSSLLPLSSFRPFLHLISAFSFSCISFS